MLSIVFIPFSVGTWRRNHDDCLRVCLRSFGPLPRLSHKSHLSRSLFSAISKVSKNFQVALEFYYFIVRFIAIVLLQPTNLSFPLPFLKCSNENIFLFLTFFCNDILGAVQKDVQGRSELKYSWKIMVNTDALSEQPSCDPEWDFF